MIWRDYGKEMGLVVNYRRRSHLLREAGAGGSNPLTPTYKTNTYVPIHGSGSILGNFWVGRFFTALDTRNWLRSLSFSVESYAFFFA